MALKESIWHCAKIVISLMLLAKMATNVGLLGHKVLKTANGTVSPRATIHVCKHTWQLPLAQQASRS